MEENNKKIQLDKTKIIHYTIVASLTVIMSAIILFCMWVVIEPIVNKDKQTQGTDASNAGYIARIEQALNRLEQKYIDMDDVDMDKLIDGAIAGMADATGDPYTRFVSEEEFNEILTSGTEKYGGIGVHLTYDKEKQGILVLGIMPDSPALEADLKAGDVIVKVGDKTVTYENYKECVDDLKGEENSTVKVTLVREDDMVMDKTLTRKIIQANNIESEVLEGNIGYIRIWSFENDVYNQFKKEYDTLMSQKVSGLIIDVRNNPGGLVPDTINILDLLLPKGDVLKLVYKDGREKVYKCQDDAQINVPLAVLVNERSASASEILASAIKDSGKGALIGNKTYGKGIVQEVEKIGNRGALSITVAKYYTMGGAEIHKNGIAPSVEVNLPDDVKGDMTIKREKDTQLKKAIEYINSKK